MKDAKIYFDIIDMFLAFTTNSRLKLKSDEKPLHSILKYFEKATWNIEDKKKQSIDISSE